MKGRVLDVAIGRLGHEGDGIAEVDGTRVFVPFTLPGERWRVAIEGPVYGGLRARPLERTGGPPRREPVCRHFGRCGGCRLQHLPEEAYIAFKLGRIREELERRRIEPEETEPLHRSPPGSRRRLRLAFERRGRAVRLGLRWLHSHTIEDLAECPVARPELVGLLAPLRDLLAAHGPRTASVLLTRAANGVDITLLADREPGSSDMRAFEHFAQDHGILRIALGYGMLAESLAWRAEPRVVFGDVRVRLPPGAFLQATEEGERALSDFVGAALRDGDRLADLHAGLGALSLPHLSRLSRLLLVDVDTSCRLAVHVALDPHQRERVELETRDLERRPLSPSELARFDVVLLDPPRAGARAQVEAIAASRIARLVYVSCNPATFARDARILTDAGFRLVRLRPVDQFVFSAEVELAALFLRG